MDASLKRRN